MTDEEVDIVSRNSVAKTSRLPVRLVDIIPILIAAFIGYRLFLAPRLAAPPAVNVGDVTIEALQGPPISLAALHGRPVFVDFFATWCEPCRQSLPVLEAFARAHPEVTLISVDVGEPPAAVRSFLKKNGLSGPARIALDREAKLNDRWQIQGYPTIVGIDEAGYARDHWYGFTPYLAAELTEAEHRYAAAGPGAGP